MERLYEFRRIKNVVEFKVVEHLVQFPHTSIEQSRRPGYANAWRLYIFLLTSAP
jgi:hypothetical protein